MNATLKFKIDKVVLEGEITIPESPRGLVIFSHGSGSSRFSPRNKLVAKFLNINGFATFLFDLLTKKEDQEFERRYDIELLSKRLEEMTRYLLNLPKLKDLPFAYFGASTGAASAIITAAKLNNKIKAVVSRGGRPDMAAGFLHSVQAPTLLIVGDLDFKVVTLNQQAFEEMECLKSLRIISGATHLFEEPGTMAQVADMSLEWFLEQMSA